MDAAARAVHTGDAAGGRSRSGAGCSGAGIAIGNVSSRGAGHSAECRGVRVPELPGSTPDSARRKTPRY